MKSRLVRAGVLATVLGVLLVGNALAAGASYWYDLTVPKFGGSVPTNNQTKQFAGQAKVCSNLVGGSYTVSVRLESANNGDLTGTWYRIDDGTRVSFNNTGAAGQSVHMRLANDWTTPVNVQANGYWSPDTGCN